MAYTDYTFYSGTFGGDILTSANAAKWLERASDEVDILTSNRLVNGLPTKEAHAIRVKKAVCAIADVLYQIEAQRTAMTANAGSAGGGYHGAVASISSGKESISYAAVSASDSVYAAAVASNAKLNELLADTAYRYLADIPDDNGVNLLYRGV